MRWKLIAVLSSCWLISFRARLPSASSSSVSVALSLDLLRRHCAAALSFPRGIHPCCHSRTLTTSSMLPSSSSSSSATQQQQQQQQHQVPVLPTLSNRIRHTLDPCVVLMKDLVGQYQNEWRDKGGIHSLAQGVVYWRPPRTATAALQSALAAASVADDDHDNNNKNNNNDDMMLHMYGPDEGLPALIEALQEKIQMENQLRNHRVMVTVGANQAYMNCILTLLGQQDKAIVFAPYYFNHVMALQMCLPEDNLLVGPCTDQGLPDLSWLEAKLAHDPNIQLVTLVNPGNPTGTYIPREIVQRVVELCRIHQSWLILDATYEYFISAANSDYDGCFPDPHVIHIFSFSKSYALAGYRCGYLVMSEDTQPLYEQMLKVQDTVPIGPPRISQVAALGALQAGREWVRGQIQSLDKGRDAILQALSCLEQVMGGSGAMYVMGKLPSALVDDQEVARQLVRDFGVAVIPGSFCGYPGWIRVCYANLPPTQCSVAASRLEMGLRTIMTRSDVSCLPSEK